MSQIDTLAVFQHILGFVIKDNPSEVRPETTFADLGLDSLATLEVIVTAEDRFGILIPDDDWSKFRTIGDAIAYVERAAVLGTRPVR